MKLYFMKKEALDILKSNLDMVYNMYFTEKDNKWLWKVCGGDPFVEFKEIQDFQLAPIDSDMSKGEVEFANCKIIYQHLSFLTESQACDERLWAGLCHSVYYDYLSVENKGLSQRLSVQDILSLVESPFLMRTNSQVEIGLLGRVDTRKLITRI